MNVYNYAKNAINGDIISIDDVNSGINKNIICPGCLRPLIAKKGNIKVHHFAHLNGEGNLSCNETALHFYVKHEIAKLNEIKIPDSNFSYHNIEYTIPSKVFKIKKTEVEKSIYVNSNKIIVDILLTLENEHKVIIEIKVNHEVDQYKKDLIKKLNYSCIEYDVKSFINTNFYSIHITTLQTNPTWVFSTPLYSNYINKIKIKSNDNMINNFYHFIESIFINKKMLIPEYDYLNDINIIQYKDVLVNDSNFWLKKINTAFSLTIDNVSIEYDDYMNKVLIVYFKNRHIKIYFCKPLEFSKDNSSLYFTYNKGIQLNWLLNTKVNDYINTYIFKKLLKYENIKKDIKRISQGVCVAPLHIKSLALDYAVLIKRNKINIDEFNYIASQSVFNISDNILKVLLIGVFLESCKNKDFDEFLNAINKLKIPEIKNKKILMLVNDSRKFYVALNKNETILMDKKEYLLFIYQKLYINLN